MQTPRINEQLVRDLVAEQFPHWAHLSVTPVASSGWDNRTFHLGDGLSVRLPSAEAYAPAVLKEQHWLPKLAPQLPLAIPKPVAMGQPCTRFPWHWSIYTWLPGASAATAQVDDPLRLAEALADFLQALQAIDVRQAPHDPQQSRGGSLHRWQPQVNEALARLEHKVDTRAAASLWQQALDAPLNAPPVLFHGDVSAGNLLIENGQLCAVIDFGGMSVGDPACDMAIAWTYFDADQRAVFRRKLAVDEHIWARGKGWALWKGLILLAGLIKSNEVETRAAPRAIEQLLNDFQ